MFKVGDLVRHRGGGPRMVVEAEGKKHPQTGEVWFFRCEWFDTDDHLQEADFKVEVLLPVTGDSK